MEYFPLTFFQQAFWDTLDYMKENAVNLSCVVFFDGKLQTGILKEAVNRVIMKNDGLRIRLSKKNEEINQYISEYRKIDIELCDFHSLDDLSFLDDWIQKEDARVMPLFDSDLFEFKILDLYNSSACFVKINHIICDGWSVSLIKRQIEDEYTWFIEQTVKDNSKRASFVTCIKNQIEYLASERFQKNIEYWMYKFRPPISATGLKPNFLARDQMKCGCVEFVIPEQVYGKLNKLSSEYQISVLVFYLSILALYLAKVNSGKDVILGTNYHNRRTPEEQRTIGYFSVMLPLRIQVDEEASFLQLMKQVAGELKSGIRYNYFSRWVLDLLRKEAIKRGFMQNNHHGNNVDQASDSGEFRGLDTVVSFENYHSNENIRYSKKLEEFFQLSIRISLMDNKLIFEILYLLELFTQSEIEHIYKNIFTITLKVLDNPKRKLSELVFE